MGQRLGFTVQTLVERYAELGQIGVSRIGTGDRAHAGSCVRCVPLPEKQLMPSVEERERLADLRAREVGDTAPAFAAVHPLAGLCAGLGVPQIAEGPLV